MEEYNLKMPTNDIEGRKNYDFISKIVEARDVRITIEEMLSQNWILDLQENRNLKILLVFYRKR